MGDGLIRTPQFSTTDPPSVSLGGDLSGLSANAVVAKINGAQVPTMPAQGGILARGASGSVGLAYMSGDADSSNGTIVVTGLQGNDVQSHTPLDGEVLTWVDANSRWEPLVPAAPAVTWNSIYNGGAVDTLNVAQSDPLNIINSTHYGNALHVYHGPYPSGDEMWGTGKDNAALLVEDQFAGARASALWLETAAPSVYAAYDGPYNEVIQVKDNYPKGLRIVHRSGSSGFKRMLQIGEGEGDASDYNIDERFVAFRSGAVEISCNADNVHYPTAGGPSDYISPALWVRMQSGAPYGATAFKVTQDKTGAGFTIVEFYDGTEARHVFNESGHVYQTPANPTGDFTANEVVMTSGGLTNNTVIGYQANITAAASDEGATFFVGYKADYTTAGLGGKVGIGFWAGSGNDLGLYSQAAVQIESSDNNRNAFDLQYTGTANVMHVGDGTDVWAIDADMRLTHTPNDIATSASSVDIGHSLTTTSGQLGAAQTMVGLASTVVGHSLDAGDSTVIALAMTMTKNSSTAEFLGLMVDAGFDWGIQSSSPIDIETDSAIGKEALKISQADADQSFVSFVGTASADKLNNISTSIGTPDGNAPASGTWTLWRMVKIDLAGTAGWIAVWQ